MLRHLRQPENIALIIACIALITGICYAAVIIGTRRTFSFYPALYPSQQTILYWLYLNLSSSTPWLILVTFIGCLFLGLALGVVKSKNLRPFPLAWFWIALGLGCGLCGISQPFGYLLALVAFGAVLVMLITAAIARAPKLGSALTLMGVALVCSMIALVGQIWFDYQHLESTITHDKGYVLGMTRHVPDDWCDSNTYHIFECDSLYMICHLKWSSDPIWCSGEPTTWSLQANEDTSELIVQADDQTFEIPLEPPA